MQRQINLQHMRQRLGIGIDTLKIFAQSLAGFAITRRHLSASAFARLVIPDTLPQEDRVIYLDCDMLVTGPLDAAWISVLDSMVLAAVRCPAPKPSFAAAIDLPFEQ